MFYIHVSMLLKQMRTEILPSKYSGDTSQPKAKHKFLLQAWESQ